MDSEVDFNEVGHGTTTNVMVSAHRKNDKRSRVPRNHQLEQVVDSYEGGGGTGGGIGGGTGGGIGGGIGGRVVPQTSSSSSTPPPYVDGQSREHLLLSPNTIPPQLRCGICHLVAFTKPKLSPRTVGHIMFCEQCILPALVRK